MTCNLFRSPECFHLDCDIVVSSKKYIWGLVPVSGIGAPQALDIIFSVVRVIKLSFAMVIRRVLGSTWGLGQVERRNNQMIRRLELLVLPQPPSWVERKAGGLSCHQWWMIESNMPMSWCLHKNLKGLGSESFWVSEPVEIWEELVCLKGTCTLLALSPSLLCACL